MSVLEQVDNPNAELLGQWKALQAESPRLRIRNAAQALKVSELELLLCSDQHQLTPLRGPFGELLQALEPLGRTMALSRNEEVVHERHGTYTDFKVYGNGAMGLCLGDIDLRAFFKHWKHGYEVLETGGETPRRSLQFFDSAGGAIHKIYQTAHTDAQAWDDCVNNFKQEAEAAPFTPVPVKVLNYPGNGQGKGEALLEGWSALQDVHHFNALLERLEIDRQEAFELVEGSFTTRLAAGSLERTLQTLAEEKHPIMVFVGNRGIVQIHTGEIHRLLPTGDWFNVMDPDFNLHIHTPGLAQCWLVRRPTSDGTVSSLDVFNDKRELVISLFGPRKPGNPEPAFWTELLAKLESTQ